MSTIYDIELTTIDGSKSNLQAYKGKAILIVNVASKCGYTKQYEGLENLYAKFKDNGLIVLGFPSNDFGAQEPGSNSEIKQFCKLTYGVTFPMYDKQPVKGEKAQPLFQYLVKNYQDGNKNSVDWNFEKFLIDKSGKIVGHFKSKIEPMSQELVSAIEKLLI